MAVARLPHMVGASMGQLSWICVMRIAMEYIHIQALRLYVFASPGAVGHLAMRVRITRPWPMRR